MKNSPSISAYIALLVVLLAIIVLYVVPVLAVNPASDSELRLLGLVNEMRGCNIESIFSNTLNADIATRCHAYIVNLLTSVFPYAGTMFMLRLPSASIVATLTLCLFRFDGTYDNLNSSFLSAMLFLTTAFVNVFCFNATPLMLSAATMILSLIALYHWMRRCSKRNSSLLAFATAASTFLIGFMALLTICLLGTVICSLKKVNRAKSAFRLVAIIIMAFIIETAFVFIITGDIGVALSVFSSTSVLTTSFLEGGNVLLSLLFFILITMFPWSVPIVFNSVWILRNIKSLVAKISSLQLLQRFGLMVLAISLPAFLFMSNFSFILLVATIFFNMPLIGKTLLAQLASNPQIWQRTGFVSAMIIALFAFVYVLTNFGIEIPLLNRYYTPTGWNAWKIMVIAAIAISIYTLWRNNRCLSQNRRYFYNIIWLYLLMQNLFIGAILPGLAI